MTASNTAEATPSRHIAIVTGAAAGLGYELVRQLIGKGWLVCGVDFNAERMRELDAEFGVDQRSAGGTGTGTAQTFETGETTAAAATANGGYRGFVGDITDEAFVRKTVAQVAALGHIDLLINNAGQPSFKVPTAYEAADVDKCLKGLKGMILFSVAALNAANEHNLTIANVMSTAATRGNANESVYCAAKWGERGYTESLKTAYKGTSVRVIGVYPGGIDTDFYRESHDYVSTKKQHTFMPASDLAQIILANLVNDLNLTVSDIRIDRNPILPQD